ncbi:c-type cytochrome [Acidisphaera rubrifaciens]|uniref:Cytochrome c class I n=1 Tax=Acidisphaera rubrifaciens HS-AP3 TaxID=1231350 RepID=A0A0D6P7Q6_9PROT|nr:c-type cytochrome [Acidisphaera rubrifaciens]GAN77233.1 cytochrome c class I [Acidisphaera rubrifaciens HS-AP3]
MNQTHAAAALAACLLLAAPHAARAQSLGDAQAGHTLARAWCSHCHAVEPATPPRSSDVAPGFAALARNPAITSRALHVLLGTSHGQMPDYRLTPRQIDDISAYVLSLKPAAPAR